MSCAFDVYSAKDCLNSILVQAYAEMADTQKEDLPKQRKVLLRDDDPYLSDSRIQFKPVKNELIEHTYKSWKVDGEKDSYEQLETFVGKVTNRTLDDADLITKKILSPDREGDNLLFMAIIVENTWLSVALINLISNRTSLNVCNKLYQTALHLSARTSNANVVRRLVVAGIEIERRDWTGNTALHIACIQGYLDVAMALVTPVTYQEIKINTYTIPYQVIPQNFNIRNADGLTCLHLTIIHDHIKLTELLLSKDADVNAIEMKAGKTCLHTAAELGKKDILELLLTKTRVKIDKKTFAGYTAAELAYYRGHDFIVYTLRCKGAKAVRPFRVIEKENDLLDYVADDSSENENDSGDMY